MPATAKPASKDKTDQNVDQKADAKASQEEQQQKKRNTELRQAASIYDEVEQLKEELRELQVRANRLREDPQQQASIEAKTKEIEDDIDALERVHTNRTKGTGLRALNAFCAFVGFDHYYGKNINDQFRIGEHDEERIIHRNDNGDVIGLSLLNIPKGPQKSLQVMQSHTEDWDELAKMEPGKKLQLGTNNPTVNKFLSIYLAAKHDRELEANSTRLGQFSYWLSNKSISLITRRKILKAEEAKEIRAAASVYHGLLEEIEKSTTLSDTQKDKFKNDLRTELNTAFNLNLAPTDDPKSWLLLGLSTERLMQYPVEHLKQLNIQLQDARVTKVFADCFKLMQQPQQKPVQLRSALV